MLIFLLILIFSYAENLALELNFYTTVGQVRQEIYLNDEYFQTYFTHQEYSAIVPGTIDFPGQIIREQDLYNSNEQLRHIDVYIHSKDCNNNTLSKAKLIDPYLLLIQHNSSQYSYVSRDQIHFNKDPLMNGRILSVQFDDLSLNKVNMTYLTRGLWWSPRYEIIVVNDYSATLRALADINNDHERSYYITNCKIMTGSVPLIVDSVARPTSTTDKLRTEQVMSSNSDTSSISSKPDSTNFGTYSYDILRKFQLLPKSVKTFSFLTTKILFNYTLEAAIYISSGSHAGSFQRVFTIQPSDFLPAGIATFYLAATGITLGQGRLSDTPKNMEQKLKLGNDPDIRYNVINIITGIRQTPIYEQDLVLNITVSNRKDRQNVLVTLNMNSGYRNTTLLIKYCSSSNIKVDHDRNDKSTLIVQAMIKANQDEKCMLVMKQSN